MEEEEWRKIEGYDNYSISNLGEVKNDNTKILLKTHIKDGYYVVTLSRNNKCKKHYIHRLIGNAFIPNPKNLPLINHKNQKRNDNRIENLEWVTNIENSQSINKICNIGCVSSYIKNDIKYYKSKLIVYGKRHQKNSKNKEICEEWLKNRRYEIENELEITKDKIY